MEKDELANIPQMEVVEMDLEHIVEPVQDLVAVVNGVAVLDPYASYQLAMAEMRINEMKEFQENYKARILEEMEKKGVVKITTDHIQITYTNPTTKETFDSKKFKEEHLDTYNQYIKTSNVKGSIKIKCLLENTK